MSASEVSDVSKTLGEKVLNGKDPANLGEL